MKGMSKFDVKKGIPVDKRYTNNGKSIYPFDKMEIDDCFDVPIEPKTEHRIRGSIYGSLKTVNVPRQFKIKITVRKIPHERILRVWRTA